MPSWSSPPAPPLRRPPADPGRAAVGLLLPPARPAVHGAVRAGAPRPALPAGAALRAVAAGGPPHAPPRGAPFRLGALLARLELLPGLLPHLAGAHGAAGAGPLLPVRAAPARGPGRRRLREFLHRGHRLRPPLPGAAAAPADAALLVPPAALPRLRPGRRPGVLGAREPGASPGAARRRPRGRDRARRRRGGARGAPGGAAAAAAPQEGASSGSPSSTARRWCRCSVSGRTSSSSRCRTRRARGCGASRCGSSGCWGWRCRSSTPAASSSTASGCCPSAGPSTPW
ncbi:unnamed protein product, partial [Coccothraustes coccothraustes]